MVWRKRRKLTGLGLVLVFAIVLAACGDDDEASSPITSDELCALLPGAEIGALMNADARVTPVANSCELVIETSPRMHVDVALLNSEGDAGFEQAVDNWATLLDIDPIAIGGVGDRAAGFADHIIVQSGQSVVRIGGWPEALVVPQLEEIGTLIAAALG